MGFPSIVLIAVAVLAVVFVAIRKAQRGSFEAPRRRTAGGAAGAIIAVIVGASASLRGRSGDADAAAGAVTDTIAAMTDEKARGTSLAIVLSIGAVVLALGVVMFIRKQNTRS